MYYNTKTRDTYRDHSDIRARVRNALFPEVITEEMLTHINVYPMVSVEPTTTMNQVAEKVSVELVEGVYTQIWNVVAASPEQVEDNKSKLANLKSQRSLEVNTLRSQANFSTFPYMGKVISCDALSRSDIDAVASHIALLGAFPTGFPNAWKAVDNTYVLLPTIEEFKSMYAAMTGQGTANFTKSQQLKSAIAAETTKAGVEQLTLEIKE